MQVFYIPPCWKTFTAWRNVWAWDKCFLTNRGIFHSQKCNFPEESFILISFVTVWFLFGPYLVCKVTLHSFEIHMWALPDPGPCQIPMWSYLSSPIMVPMCFLCAPFVVLVQYCPLWSINGLHDSIYIFIYSRKA